MKKPLRPSQKRVRAGKNKGKKYERDLVDRLLPIYGSGLYAREMGQPGSDIKDDSHLLPWDYTEAKHWKAYPSLGSVVKLMEDRSKGRQVFFYKANNKPSLVIMTEKLLLKILGQLEHLQEQVENLVDVQENAL